MFSMLFPCVFMFFFEIFQYKISIENPKSWFSLVINMRAFFKTERVGGSDCMVNSFCSKSNNISGVTRTGKKLNSCTNCHGH